MGCLVCWFLVFVWFCCLVGFVWFYCFAGLLCLGLLVGIDLIEFRFDYRGWFYCLGFVELVVCFLFDWLVRLVCAAWFWVLLVVSGVFDLVCLSVFCWVG